MVQADQPYHVYGTDNTPDPARGSRVPGDLTYLINVHRIHGRQMVHQIIDTDPVHRIHVFSNRIQILPHRLLHVMSSTSCSGYRQCPGYRADWYGRWGAQLVGLRMCRWIIIPVHAYDIHDILLYTV